MDPLRPTPTLGDSENTRRVLVEWFGRQMPGASNIEVTDLEIPEGTGMSNVTVLFGLSWQEGGEQQTRPCVGRFEPEGGGAAFPEYDLGHQYRVMDTIGKHTDIAVPALLGLEEDLSVLGVPFYIMARVDGVVPSDMPPYHEQGWLKDECSPEQRRTLWMAGIEEMAKIHVMDDAAMGLSYVEFDEPGNTPLEKQLNYWQRYMEWGMEGRQHLHAQRALAWLFANQPADETFKLCWGDSRMGNMLFNRDTHQVSAVLDWEMVTMGNPLQDLAWWIYLDRFFSEGLNLPRLEGLPDEHETVALWQSLTGLSAEHYDYYVIFSGLRYTLILSRLMLHMGIEDMVLDHFATPMLVADLEKLGG